MTDGLNPLFFNLHMKSEILSRLLGNVQLLSCLKTLQKGLENKLGLLHPGNLIALGLTSGDNAVDVISMFLHDCP